MRLRYLFIAASSCLEAQTPASVATPPTLEGLWAAKRSFGPDVRGRLTIDRPTANGPWRAAIAGRVTDVRVAADTMSFRVDGGTFVGRVVPRRNAIVGHWTQPRTQVTGTGFATPITLTSCGASCYRGDVVPIDDGFTYYLNISKRPDGSLGAVLRNPERNLGHRFIPVWRIERAGTNVALLDRRDTVLAAGTFRDGVITVPLRGGTYDFRRVPDTAFTHAFPWGRPTATYRYVAPKQESDGWQVGTLREVGIDEDSVAAVVRRIIATRPDSSAVQETHALLIARHGKLVFEEYFHGEHAEKAHDSRSASKSFVTTLIGAAIQAGLPISMDTRVYATLRPDTRDLPAGKQAMTLEHLLRMNAGYDCDDNGDVRPANEDVITDQDSNPDWTRVGLDVGLVREPGALSVYCSIQPHIAGRMLARVTGRKTEDLMWELLGEPLDMRGYHMFLSPLGEVYFGGGHRIRARDFLKYAQLHLDGGTWRGRRILSREWVERAIEPRSRIANQGFGYIWWSLEWPVRGRQIRGYYASGNGVQFTMWFPELDLAVVTMGANYNSPVAGRFIVQQITRTILPAVVPR